MPRKKALIVCLYSLAVISPLMVTTSSAFAAGKEKLLVSFTGANGIAPEAGMIFNVAGNLYGTTVWGGSQENCPKYPVCGTVFELTPSGNGTWTQTVLYTFCSVAGCSDGYDPQANLISDSKGNLYSTTTSGGAYGGGTVFELAPGGGTWTETVLYSFCAVTSCLDGNGPFGSLIFDAAGGLYGTTQTGGTYGCGTVFKLTLGGGGAWTQTVLYSFYCAGVDGVNPTAGLIFDASGNLYGTTRGGGNYGKGTVFRLTALPHGKWSEKVLHSFRGPDGRQPLASLIADKAGRLYGTTYQGGTLGIYGTVFRLARAQNGQWKEKVLHSFNGMDGWYPTGSLIFDGAGNLYGTTQDGGQGSGCAHTGGCGAVFELSLEADGKWKETILHNFNHNSKDGWDSSCSLVFDTKGNLFGTTIAGGSPGTGCGGAGCGTVFEITP